MTHGRNSKNILTTVHENSISNSKETIGNEKKLKLTHNLIIPNPKRIICSATSRSKGIKTDLKIKNEKKVIISKTGTTSKKLEETIKKIDSAKKKV